MTHRFQGIIVHTTRPVDGGGKRPDASSSLSTCNEKICIQCKTKIDGMKKLYFSWEFMLQAGYLRTVHDVNDATEYETTGGLTIVTIYRYTNINVVK